MNQKQFKLPSTGKLVNISFQSFQDQIDFAKVFGADMVQYKPVNMTWKEYSTNLQHWLDKGTIEQINETGRQDLKILFVKQGKAKQDNLTGKLIPNRTLGDLDANIHTQTGDLEKLRREIRIGRYPDIRSINVAVNLNHLNVVNYLASLNPPLLPNRDAADRAVNNHNMHALEWLASRNPPILPTTIGANMAIQNSDLEMLIWLAGRNPPILPNVEGANLAAGRGDIRILNWLAAQNPPILPNSSGANTAFILHRQESLNWLAQRNPPILPTI